MSNTYDDRLDDREETSPSLFPFDGSSGTDWYMNSGPQRKQGRDNVKPHKTVNTRQRLAWVDATMKQHSFQKR